MRIWGRGRADLHLFCDQIGMIKGIEWFNKWKSQFIQRVTIRSNDTIPSSAKLRGPALAPGSQSNEGRTRSKGVLSENYWDNWDHWDHYYYKYIIIIIILSIQ